MKILLESIKVSLARPDKFLKTCHVWIQHVALWPSRVY